MANLTEILEAFTKGVGEGGVRSLADFLPLLRLEDKPMNLRLHFFFAPLFQFNIPRRIIFKTARQVGKSQSIGAVGTLQSGFIKNFHTLFIQPRFDQIKFFSNSIVKPLINQSYIKSAVINRSCEENVLIRTFANGSRMHFGFCFLDADRIRGIAAVAKCCIDECQDIDNDNIPVIGQTMAAQRKYGVFQFTGTPKTTDNTLSLLFDDSSAAEWVIPCKACNKLNVPCVSQDLLNMIGKETCVCAKCGKPLDARHGWFEHANPMKRWEFPGYHVSQIIHPLHYTDTSKWRELLYNMHTYQKARFWNEVLGEPCDESVKLVTVQDIQKASRGGLNNLQEAVKRRAGMETVVLGVDWGGKGALENSFTAVCAVGWRPGSDVLECIYAERFPIGSHELDENRWIMEYSSTLKASFVAHDYTGAGAMREIFLVQGGMDESRMAPFTYTNTPRQEVIKYCPPGAGTRRSWSIDKTQSYVILINMLKGGKVILPEFESSFEVTKDLLSLVEDVKEMPFASNMYRIGKTPKKSDDFASALNLACSTIWHIKDCYPTVVDAERYKVSREALEAANPARVNWR